MISALAFAQDAIGEAVDLPEEDPIFEDDIVDEPYVDNYDDYMYDIEADEIDWYEEDEANFYIPDDWYSTGSDKIDAAALTWFNEKAFPFF